MKSPLPEIPYRYFKDFIAPGADRFLFLRDLLDKLDLRNSILTISGNRHFMVFPSREGQSSHGGQSSDPHAASQASSVPIGGLGDRAQPSVQPLPRALSPKDAEIRELCPQGQSRQSQDRRGGTSPLASSVPIAPTVLVAHYDRVADSPGANDNSAAVFLLIETALKLRQKKAKNWIIIFTDKEELSSGEGLKSQGSYTLAAGLRQAGLGGGRFFIFDACGTGDTLIISTTADHLMKDEQGTGTIKKRQAVQRLRTLALETARALQMDKVLLLPTPFSDDAGFLRAGIPAQTITVLPGKEAGPFISSLRNKPGLAQALVNREVQKNYDRLLIPETWRCLNGPGDSRLRLTPEHFFRVVQFACALGRT